MLDKDTTTYIGIAVAVVIIIIIITVLILTLGGTSNTVPIDVSAIDAASNKQAVLVPLPVKEYRLLDASKNGAVMASHGSGSFFPYKVLPGVDDQKWVFDPNTGLVSNGFHKDVCITAQPGVPGAAPCDKANSNMIWTDDGTKLVSTSTPSASWSYEQYS